MLVSSIRPPPSKVKSNSQVDAPYVLNVTQPTPPLDLRCQFRKLFLRRFLTVAAPHTPMKSEEIGMAIRSFLSETCPVCGAAKTVAEDPFCEGCLAVLPPGLLEAVTDRSTYLDAFGPSYRHLLPLRSR